MTELEALTKAQQRWGRNARVWQTEIGRILGVYHVGFKPAMGRGRIGQRYYSVQGSGSSWEAAFADADKRLEATEIKSTKDRK